MSSGLLSFAWYRLLIGLAGRVRHPHAASALAAHRTAVGLHYHGLGGDVGRRVASNAGGRRLLPATTDAGTDLLAWLDRDQLHLPEAVNRFPTERLNRDVYFWLAAFLALDRPLAGEQILGPGVRYLLRGIATSTRVVERFPGLAARYADLCGHELEQRRSALPALGVRDGGPVHQLEAAVRHTLGDAEAPRDDWLVQAMASARAGVVPEPPARWRSLLVPFLPVLLWGRPVTGVPGLRLRWLRRRVRRRPRGWTKTLSEARFDADQRADPQPGSSLRGEHVFPEWDCERREYRPDWCRVSERIPAADPRGEESADVARLARRVHRQFEALRQVRGWQRHLEIGEELDVDAFVDCAGDARRLGARSERVYRHRQPRLRDLSVAVLVDLSRSTEAWVGELRGIEVARRSMLVLGEALSAVGDDFALFGFASDSRHRVRCQRFKGFDEPYSQTVRWRLRAMKPADYTRMGAAVRHVGATLEKRPGAHKLLLVLTDGRPHDPTDGYEGRYAVQDTRRSLAELAGRGVSCFGLTIDRHGGDYLPYLFGPGHFAVFSRAESLPRVLPKLYARVTGLGA